MPTTPSPSDSPTSELVLVYDPPTLQDCETIAQGGSVDGQLQMLPMNFQIDLEVLLTFSIDTGIDQDGLQELREKFQSVIAPELAGCHIISNASSRKLQKGGGGGDGGDGTIRGTGTRLLLLDSAIRFMIGNGIAKVMNQATPCENESLGNNNICYQVKR